MSSKHYSITTELSDIHLEETLDFIEEYFLRPQGEYYHSVNKSILDGVAQLNFTAINEKEKWEVLVELQATNPFRVKMTPVNNQHNINITHKMDIIEEDLLIAIQVTRKQFRQAHFTCLG